MYKYRYYGQLTGTWPTQEEPTLVERLPFFFLSASSYDIVYTGNALGLNTRGRARQKLSRMCRRTTITTTTFKHHWLRLCHTDSLQLRPVVFGHFIYITMKTVCLIYVKSRRCLTIIRRHILIYLWGHSDLKTKDI